MKYHLNTLGVLRMFLGIKYKAPSNTRNQGTTRMHFGKFVPLLIDHKPCNVVHAATGGMINLKSILTGVAALISKARLCTKKAPVLQL